MCSDIVINTELVKTIIEMCTGYWKRKYDYIKSDYRF